MDTAALLELKATNGLFVRKALQAARSGIANKARDNKKVVLCY